jgi:hypothetical protein
LLLLLLLLLLLQLQLTIAPSCFRFAPAGLLAPAAAAGLGGSLALPVTTSNSVGCELICLNSFDLQQMDRKQTNAVWLSMQRAYDRSASSYHDRFAAGGLMQLYLSTSSNACTAGSSIASPSDMLPLLLQQLLSLYVSACTYCQSLEMPRPLLAECVPHLPRKVS